MIRLPTALVVPSISARTIRLCKLGWWWMDWARLSWHPWAEPGSNLGCINMYLNQMTSWLPTKKTCSPSMLSQGSYWNPVYEASWALAFFIILVIPVQGNDLVGWSGNCIWYCSGHHQSVQFYSRSCLHFFSNFCLEELYWENVILCHYGQCDLFDISCFFCFMSFIADERELKEHLSSYVQYSPDVAFAIQRLTGML